jgi:3-hydroxyisobutyrate dehydrogenase-like beta-hydroxyacid dehydrogenase
MIVNTENIGILHPGSMGVSVAASAKNSGHTVFWASAGRSPQTHERVQQVELEDAGTLAQLCASCSVIVSVCPPAAAEDLANEVLAHGFTGLYVDANAIAPERADRIHAAVAEAGANFVDGGIIGGPAWKPDSTWLYLSGTEADRAAACFSAGPLVARVIGDTPGKASALKMCFAAYTKGTTALLCAIMAAAESLDVRTELEAQWSENGSDFAEQTQQRVRNVTDRAWRFTGEMDEIAATLSGAGVPGEFHRAAGEIYQRIAHFKDSESTPPLEDVLAALLQQNQHR